MSSWYGASVLRAQIALRLGREEYHNPHGEAPISHWTRAFSAEEQWFQVGLFEENAMNLEVDQPAYRYFINSQSTGPVLFRSEWVRTCKNLNIFILFWAMQTDVPWGLAVLQVISLKDAKGFAFDLHGMRFDSN